MLPSVHHDGRVLLVVEVSFVVGPGGPRGCEEVVSVEEEGGEAIGTKDRKKKDVSGALAK